MAKYGASFWLLALVTNLILLVKQLMVNFKKTAELKKYTLLLFLEYTTPLLLRARQRRERKSSLP